MSTSIIWVTNDLFNPIQHQKTLYIEVHTQLHPATGVGSFSMILLYSVLIDSVMFSWKMFDLILINVRKKGFIEV